MKKYVTGYVNPPQSLLSLQRGGYVHLVTLSKPINHSIIWHRQVATDHLSVNQQC